MKTEAPPQSAAQPIAGQPANAGADALEKLPTRERKSVPLGIATVVVVVVAVLIIVSVATNKAIQWDVVGQFLFDGRVLAGVLITIEITAVSMLIGLILALVVALMRLSKSRLLKGVAVAYTWLFRAIPLLVLLILTFNFALFYPKVGLGVPFGPMFWSVSTPELITPFWAAVIAFALNEGAYSAEIIRASIISVPRGQEEAATALGMTRSRLYRRVVLPQAVRIALPALFNDLINMLKGTSIVAFIGVFDLMYTVQSIYQISYQIAPLLVVATIWYLVLVTVLTGAQYLLESKFSFSRRESLWRRLVIPGGGSRR